MARLRGDGPGLAEWFPWQLPALPNYFLIITYSISYSIPYIVFYNYLIGWACLKRVNVLPLNQDIGIGSCKKLYRE